jgi:hypothetical protein
MICSSLGKYGSPYKEIVNLASIYHHIHRRTTDELKVTLKCNA